MRLYDMISVIVFFSLVFYGSTTMWLNNKIDKKCGNSIEKHEQQEKIEKEPHLKLVIQKDV